MNEPRPEDVEIIYVPEEMVYKVWSSRYGVWYRTPNIGQALHAWHELNTIPMFLVAGQ